MSTLIYKPLNQICTSEQSTPPLRPQSHTHSNLLCPHSHELSNFFHTQPYLNNLTWQNKYMFRLYHIIRLFSFSFYTNHLFWSLSAKALLSHSYRHFSFVFPSILWTIHTILSLIQVASRSSLHMLMFLARFLINICSLSFRSLSL